MAVKPSGGSASVPDGTPEEQAIHQARQPPSPTIAQKGNLMHTARTVRRTVTAAAAATLLAALAAACGSSGTTASSAASPTSSSVKKGLTVYFIPKDTQNPYEVIADQGGQAALSQLGGKVVVSSGTADTAAAQIPSIQAAIQAHANAIVIAGNDPAALCPSLAQAQAAGVVVVSFDSDVTCPNHLFINQANTKQIGTSEVDLLGKEMG